MSLHYYTVSLLCSLRQQGIIGPAVTRSLLELGEQNWFHDVSVDELPKLAAQLIADPAERTAVEAQVAAARSAEREAGAFALAKIFYRILFGELRQHVAIDFHGTAVARKYDLGQPLPLTEQFDLVYNGGTAEHVFNVGQVFKSVHERTAPRGIMIHDLPNQGWPDHGFFNFHPTLCFDLADANGYEFLFFGSYRNTESAPEPMVPIPNRTTYARRAAEGKLTSPSTLLAVFRKPAVETPFQVPLQGYYNQRLSAQLTEAWKANR